jgi:hypothetical protein
LPPPGAKRVYGDTTDKRILAMLDRPVPKGRARWNGKLLAKELGDVDVNYVRRFLRKHKIDLSGRKSWCESKGPEFAAKAADVVGLYISPPANAIVLCIDEKPSIQALERAQGYQVECWFSIPQGQSLTGASFKSVDDLKAHIDAHIAEYNNTAEPSVWTKSKVHQRRVKGRRLSEL